MTNNTALVRSMIVYGICLPLAIILGYLIADPLDKTTDLTLGIVAFFLILPLLLRWYHTWLIVVWNMAIVLTFLPGLFPWWIPLSCIGFAVAIGHYILNRERKFLPARSISWSLIVLALVVLVTAKFRGGLGFRALGNESVGAKRYVWIWAAVIGYFALISQRIPSDKRRLYTSLFLFGTATQIVSDIGPYLGPISGFFSIFFPGVAGSSALPTSPLDEAAFQRFGGVANAGVATAFVLVARYGIEGVLELKKLWRLMLFAVAMAMCGFGGYRSLLLMAILTLSLAFYFEGLLRSRLMPIAVLCMVLAGGITVAFSDHLPLPIQRCLTILPVKLDPAARASAEASSNWRLEIWTYLMPQVPHYLLLGKGLTFDANDMAEYTSLGYQPGGEVGGGYTLAGEYHNGPLSVIIPFGIWGAIAFIWFLVASIKVLWANYKYGDPEIHKTNTFLMSYFLARTILFFAVFGGFYSELFFFAGLVAFSISLNGGVAKPAAAPVQAQVVFNRFRPLPGAQPVPALKRG